MTTAKDWIQKYEEYLSLVKNRANNTVRGYVADVELLHRFALAGKVEDWGTFSESDAVAYMRYLKSSAKESAVMRKVYSLRGFFKFLRKNRVTALDPFEDVEFNHVHRTLPKVLTVQEVNRLLGDRKSVV